MKDRWRGFVRGLKLREFDHFTDHSITRYIEYIRGRSTRRNRSTRIRCRSCVEATAVPRAAARRRESLRTAYRGGGRALLVLVLLLFLLALRRTVGFERRPRDAVRIAAGALAGVVGQRRVAAKRQQLDLAAMGCLAVAAFGPRVAAVGRQDPRRGGCR